MPAPTKPTEADYDDAMRRHGTPRWTKDDQKVVERWLDGRVSARAVEQVAGQQLDRPPTARGLMSPPGDGNDEEK